METGIRASAQHLKDTKITQALDWISSTRYPAKYQDVLRNRTDGTGEWFLKTPEFEKWLDHEEVCLLCSGDPGTGKTIIAATAIEHVLSTDTRATVAYIFCDYQTKNSMQVLDYLSALLQQIASQNAGRVASAVRPLLKLYDEYKDNGGVQPSEAEIRQALTSTIAASETVYIVIDALDECSEEVLEELMDSIAELTRSHHNIRLLFTSRPLDKIVGACGGLEEEFPSMLKVQITAQEADVRAYVRSYLGTQRTLKRDAELSQRIEDTIARAVGGL